MDEQLAERVAELPDDGRPPKWERSHRDYSPEVEMLSAVYDRVGELIAVTSAVHGGRGKPPAPAPRPTYAVARVRKRLREEKHRSIVSRVLKKPAR